MNRRNFLAKGLAGGAGVVMSPLFPLLPTAPLPVFVVPPGTVVASIKWMNIITFDGAKLTLPGQAYFGDPSYVPELPDENGA